MSRDDGRPVRPRRRFRTAAISTVTIKSPPPPAATSHGITAVSCHRHLLRRGSSSPPSPRRPAASGNTRPASATWRPTSAAVSPPRGPRRRLLLLPATRRTGSGQAAVPAAWNTPLHRTPRPTTAARYIPNDTRPIIISANFLRGTVFTLSACEQRNSKNMGGLSQSKTKRTFRPVHQLVAPTAKSAVSNCIWITHIYLPPTR